MGTSLNGLTPAGTYPGLIKTGDNAPIDGTLKTLSDGNGNNLPMEASTTAVNFTGTLTQAGATLQPTLVSGTNIKTINGTSLLGSGNIPVVTSPSGIAGAIQFSNGSAFASDASNLFWDDTNNRLGVGTNAPTAILQAENSTNGVLLARFKDALASTSYIDIKNDVTLTDYTGLYWGGTYKILSKQTGATFLNCANSVNFADGYATKMAVTSSEVQIGSISGAKLGIKGSGSTSATTSLLVQNSDGDLSFKVNDSQLVQGFSGSIVRFKLGNNGTSGQAISTRDGQFAIGLIDTDQLAAIRFLTLGTGASYIDAYSEGTSKAANYPLFIGSRTNNTSTLVTGSTTQENGTPVVFGSAVYDASALVQINSTTRGFLPPRMTTTEKNAIATPASGLVVYDSTTNKLCCYNGSTWNDLF